MRHNKGMQRRNMPLPKFMLRVTWGCRYKTGVVAAARVPVDLVSGEAECIGCAANPECERTAHARCLGLTAGQIAQNIFRCLGCRMLDLGIDAAGDQASNLRTSVK